MLAAFTSGGLCYNDSELVSVVMSDINSCDDITAGTCFGKGRKMGEL